MVWFVPVAVVVYALVAALAGVVVGKALKRSAPSGEGVSPPRGEFGAGPSGPPEGT